MIFHGNRFGVHLVTGSILWFTSLLEAEAAETNERAKFAAVDAERERLRLAKMGLKEITRTYSITVPDAKLTHRSRR